jgi:predicted MFS family arabinose efflux permease
MNSGRFTLWIMWLIASFFYAYQYVIRVLPSIMISDIMSKFDIDAALFGQFSGIYYIGYALTHIPIGILLDRIGAKKTLPIFICLTILGVAPLVWSNFWIYPVIGRFLVGVGASSAILGVFKITRMAFAEKRFPIMLSWSVTIGLTGAIYGGGPLNYLKSLWGFENVVYALMILGCILAIFTYFLIPEQKQEPVNKSVWLDIKNVLGHKKVMAVCLLAGCMVGPLEGFADVWGSTFLHTVYGMEETLASSLPSIIFLGMACGAPFLSWIASRLNNYLVVILACGLFMGLAFVLLLQTNLPATWLSILFFIVGILSSYQILAIYEVSTYVAPRVAGLTNAMANMIIMTFGYVFHSLIGETIDMFSNRQGYLPLDSSQALIYGIWIIPAGLFLGTLGLALIMLLKTPTPDKKFI